jgi:hypothetical protein
MPSVGISISQTRSCDRPFKTKVYLLYYSLSDLAIKKWQRVASLPGKIFPLFRNLRGSVSADSAGSAGSDSCSADSDSDSADSADSADFCSDSAGSGSADSDSGCS